MCVSECSISESSSDCQHGLYHSVKCLCSLLTSKLIFFFFFGSNAGGSYFRAGESGPKQEAFGAEVDRGQWLIPPESSKRGMERWGGKRDVLYEGKQREKHTQPYL